MDFDGSLEAQSLSWTVIEKPDSLVHLWLGYGPEVRALGEVLP